MFLKKMRIVNFRGFGKGEDGEGTTIDLNKGSTAFIGRNGIGKTTILEAINYLLGPESQLSKITEKDFNCDANGIDDEIIIEGETYNPFYFKVDVLTQYYGYLNDVKVVIPCNIIRLLIKRRKSKDNTLDEPLILHKNVLPIIGTINEDSYKNEQFLKHYSMNPQLMVIPKEGEIYSSNDIVSIYKTGRAIKISETLSEDTYNVRFLINKDDSYVEDSGAFSKRDLKYNPENVIGLPKVYYLSKERDEDVSGQHSLISKILNDLHWRYKKEQGNDVDGFVRNYSELAFSLRRMVDEKGVLINSINNKIRAICSDDVDFQIDFMDIEQPYRAAFIAKKEGNKLLLPDNLGSGFNILIAFSLFAHIAEKESIPIVFIIDEPELHLHSDWERKMYKMFSSQTDMQIIYSTQSENFVSLKNWRQIRSLKDAQIYPREDILNSKVTTDHGKKVSIIKLMDDYANNNLHISTVLRENLEMFFSKKCVLVEGPGEKYALPILLELKGVNLDNYSISIIPVWGKTKLKIYQLICKSFGIDYFTLFDRDRPEDGENTLIEKNAQKDKIYSFSTSFEKKLGIGENEKFRKLVEKIDHLENLSNIDAEIIKCLEKLGEFITEQVHVAE